MHPARRVFFCGVALCSNHQPEESAMAEVKPMTTATMDPAASPPAGTIANPGASQKTADQRHTEEQALRGKVYELRRNSDPTIYDRVVAFHPHAATSDEAFATFKADLERSQQEAAEKLAAAAPEKPAP
jgi:hypothetical protein